MKAWEMFSGLTIRSVVSPYNLTEHEPAPDSVEASTREDLIPQAETRRFDDWPNLG
jgi:hypothetical protein